MIIKDNKAAFAETLNDEEIRSLGAYAQLIAFFTR